MKNKFMMILFLVSTQMFLVNCAKSSDSPAAVANTAYGQCAVGQVSTSAGCIPLAANGQCVQAGYGYTPQTGCLPPVYNNGVNGTNATTCQYNQVGYYQTVAGCLPQGVCPVNYGFYQGTTYQVPGTGQVMSSPTGFCFARTQ